MDSDNKSFVIVLCALFFGVTIIASAVLYNSRMESEAAMKAGLQQMVVNNNVIWIKNDRNNCED